MACYFHPAGIRFNNFLFTDPVPFSSWRPPGCAGIVAILARNPQWGPKPLQPVCFVEFGNNTRLPASTRVEDLMVAVLPMPYSSAVQRRAACRELIAGYNPACQSMLSTAEMAYKIEELEVRQQEQSEQIKSLLTYIARLFEPQPVGPRRPIGFLPQLVSVEAGTTGSGS
jgi:hypothetical protein